MNVYYCQGCGQQYVDNPTTPIPNCSACGSSAWATYPPSIFQNFFGFFLKKRDGDSGNP